MKRIIVIASSDIAQNYAYSLINQNVNIDEIVFIGEKDDPIYLNQGASFFKSRIKLRMGSYNLSKDASMVIITGKQDKSSLSIIIENLKKYNFDGMYLIATENVNVDSYLVQSISSVPNHKVIGIGTMIETSYLKYLIGDRLNINVDEINAYVLGDNKNYIIPWACFNIGILPLCDCMSEDVFKCVIEEFKNNFNLNTYLISLALANLTISIINDTNNILTVSSYDLETGIYISLPSIVDRLGVREVIDIGYDIEKEKTIKYIKDEINKL